MKSFVLIRSKNALLFAFTALAIFTSLSEAKADDLIADSCIAAPVEQSASLVSNADFRDSAELRFENISTYGSHVPGMTCQDLQSAKEAVTAIGIALQPAITAIVATGVRAEIDAALLAIGFANPAMIGVRVLGAAGISVVFLILKKSFKECAELDRAEFRNEIVDELAAKYGIQAPAGIKIQYQNK